MTLLSNDSALIVSIFRKLRAHDPDLLLKCLRNVHDVACARLGTPENGLSATLASKFSTAMFDGPSTEPTKSATSLSAGDLHLSDFRNGLRDFSRRHQTRFAAVPLSRSECKFLSPDNRVAPEIRNVSPKFRPQNF